MRKLVVSEFVSVDGVFEDPGGSEKFKYGGWQMPLMGPEGGKYKFEELKAANALLLGKVTYQGFAAAWPNMTDLGEFADRMNNYPKYVVSKTLKKLDWNNSQAIRQNIAQEVAELKRQSGKDILVFGSGQLVRWLLDHNLVDELRLMVHPIVLGAGKQLFKDAEKKTLKLVDTKTFKNGTIVLTYKPITK